MPGTGSLPRRRKPHARPGRSTLVLALCHATALGAAAQTWRAEPSIKATVTATNNSGFSNSTTTGSDTVVDVLPRFALTGRGARFKLDAYAEASGITYLERTLPNDVVPKARLALNGTAIERWLYLDAAAGLQQVAASPYSPVSNGAPPAFRIDSTQYRLSPYIDHAFSPNVSLVYRNDNLWTRQREVLPATDPRRNSLVQSNRFAFTQRPIPLGYSLEANQERTRYTNSADATLDLKSARGVVSYALDPTLEVGLVGGRERSELSGLSFDDSIRGLRLRWRPSERTDLNANAERRFFDKGWDVLFTHRSPFLAMNLNLSRQPASQPSSFLLPSAGNDFRTLIDAAYTTRYPNPTERAIVVNNTIAALGNTANTTGPSEVYSDYAQVQQRAALSVAFLSSLSALSFQLYSLKSEQLKRIDSGPLVLPPTAADSIQYGGSVVFNRRLTSTTTVEAIASGAKTEGIGVSTGLAASTKSVSLGGTQALSPKTKALVGTRRQISKSTVFGATQETAAFAGIEHKF